MTTPISRMEKKSIFACPKCGRKNQKENCTCVTEPQHTPMLTARGQNIFYEYGYEGRTSGRLMAECKNADEAAFIVRAVNAHEELVNLLKAMLPFVSIAGHQINGQPAFDVVKEAIAKAEGK